MNHDVHIRKICFSAFSSGNILVHIVPNPRGFGSDVSHSRELCIFPFDLESSISAYTLRPYAFLHPFNFCNPLSLPASLTSKSSTPT